MSATPPAPPPSGVLAALSPATLVGWEKRAERASKSMTADELTLDEAVALATIRTSRHIRYMWTVLAILLILSVLFGIFGIWAAQDSSTSQQSSSVCFQYPSLC